MTNIETTTVELLDGTLTLIEFCSYTRLSQQHVIDMIDAGVLKPLGEMTRELDDLYSFASRDLRRVRIARRLIDDLGINLEGVAMILDLVEERDELHRRVAILEKMLDF